MGSCVGRSNVVSFEDEGRWCAVAAAALVQVRRTRRLGGFLAIASVALLTDHLAVALVLGSFGASCVLVFGFPDVPFAQPRNVIAGHFLSSLIGLAFLTASGRTGGQWRQRSARRSQ